MCYSYTLERWGRAAASTNRGRAWSTWLAQGYSLCPVTDWWRVQRPGPLPQSGSSQLQSSPEDQLRPLLQPQHSPASPSAQSCSLHSRTPGLASSIQISTSESVSRERGLRQWEMVQEQESWSLPCQVQVQTPLYWLCNCGYVLSLRFLSIKWGLWYLAYSVGGLVWDDTWGNLGRQCCHLKLCYCS